jgi:hypothetical protein
MLVYTLVSVLCLVAIVLLVLGSINLYVRNKLGSQESEEAPEKENIDMVISWAGQDTPERTAIRAQYDLEPRRYRDNGELQKLLYSIDLYASNFVRHIFIVLPDQSLAPGWLTQHPKVRLVRESEILEHAPTFNSQAIETSLDRIPNLSSRFFYSCDDMLFTAPVKKEDWFDLSGRYIVPKGDCIPKTELFPGLHYKSWVNNHRQLQKIWPGHKTKRPAHVMVMLSKVGFARARELFTEKFEKTSMSKVREDTNIHPIGLVLNVDLRENRAILRHKKAFHFAVYPSGFWNRLRRNLWLSTMKGVKLASIDDGGGSEKHHEWVDQYLYEALLDPSYRLKKNTLK